VTWVPQWTGFARKTLWDWLQLLIVPAILIGVTFVWSATQTRSDNKREDRRTAADRAAAEEARRDATLQTYLDRMSDLIIHEGLLSTKRPPAVAEVAHTLTVAALRRLDGARKGQVVLFLGDASLLNPGSRMLLGADLTGADLRNAYLPESWIVASNLRGANLHGATLTGSLLESANLRDADLGEADLHKADLSDAQLQGADLTNANVGALTLRAPTSLAPTSQAPSSPTSTSFSPRGSSPRRTSTSADSSHGYLRNGRGCFS
jgi:Pentapeptide repeats (8 copies)